MLEQANFVPKPLILVGEVQILMERHSRVTIRCWSLVQRPILIPLAYVSAHSSTRHTMHLLGINLSVSVT